MNISRREELIYNYHALIRKITKISKKFTNSIDVKICLGGKDRVQRKIVFNKRDRTIVTLILFNNI